MVGIDWDEVVEEALDNSFRLGVPSVRKDDTYVIYSAAYLTALRFGRLLAIDAGAGAGFSTIWVAKAIYESHVEGRIHAVEKTVQRFRKLEELVNKHGLTHLITPVNDDALKYVQNFKNRLHFVFMDIDKEHYLDFFRLVKDKILTGGVVLAHNVNHGYGSVNAFLNKASVNGWKTIIVPTGEGVSISFKTA